MLIKESAVCPRLPFFFFSFSCFSSVVGVGKEGQSLEAPATPLAPWIPTGFHFPAHRLSHLGVWARREWRQYPSALMNSFQAACCRSHLLLRPGVGETLRRRLCPGGGGAGRRPAGGGRLAAGPESFPGTPGRRGDTLPFSSARWVGSGSPARLAGEEVVGNQDVPRGALGLER